MRSVTEAKFLEAENKRLKKEVKALIKESITLQKGVEDVRYLIENSDGVCGLHLARGTVTTWEEIRHGGPFSEWLENFDKADTI